MKISFDNVTYFEGSRMYMKNGDEFDTSIDLEKAVDIVDNYDSVIVCLGELPQLKDQEIFIL